MTMSFQMVRRLWWGLSALQGLLIVHLIAYLVQPGKGDSPAFRLLALGVAGLSLGVIGAALWLTPTRLDRLRRITRPFQWPYVLGGVAILFVFGLFIRPEWFYAHMALTLAAALTVIDWSLYDTATPVKHRRVWLFGGITAAVVICLIRINGLTVYPTLHSVDEPWTLGWTVNYLKTGKLGDWIMPNRSHKIVAFYIVLSEWLRIVGFGFWQARLFSFSLTLVTLVFTVLAARNLFGNTTALFTGAALFCSSVLISGARVRHDIGLGVNIALSLWLYSEAIKRKRINLHFFAGMAMGFGVFSHFHAAPLGAAMAAGLYGVPYLSRLKKKQWRPGADPLLYGLGGLVAFAVAIAIQGVPDTVEKSVNAASQRSLGLTGLVQAALQHTINISHFSQVEFLLIFLGIAAACWRRREIDLILVSSVAFAHLALGFASNGKGFEYYLVPLAPLYGLLVGSLFGGGFARQQIPPVQPLAQRHTQGLAIATSFFLAASLGSTLDIPLRHLVLGKPDFKTPPVSQWVLDHVDTTATIAGDHYYFLWLTDYHYVSPLTPNLMDSKKRVQYASLDDVWVGLNIDVFIVDPNRSSYPLLRPLVEDEFFARHGYKEVAHFGAVQIFQRTPQ